VPYDVSFKTIPPQTVLSVRTITPMERLPADIGAAYAEIMPQVEGGPAAYAGPPFIIYHDMDHSRVGVDMEVCLPVTAPQAAAGRVQCLELPAVTVACTLHRGPYDEIGNAYQALQEEIDVQRRAAAGPPREVYLNDPGQVASEELLTEVQLPVV
jgi:effector-binding domain-containing protein